MKFQNFTSVQLNFDFRISTMKEIKYFWKL